MSGRKHDPQEARRWADALTPFKVTLRVWDRLLDAHPDGCECQLCGDLYPLAWVLTDLCSALECKAPGAALALVDAEIGADDDAPAVVQAPRGGYF